jgi:hypothetical protein
MGTVSGLATRDAATRSRADPQPGEISKHVEPSRQITALHINQGRPRVGNAVRSGWCRRSGAIALNTYI